MQDLQIREANRAQPNRSNPQCTCKLELAKGTCLSRNLKCTYLANKKCQLVLKNGSTLSMRLQIRTSKWESLVPGSKMCKSLQDLLVCIHFFQGGLQEISVSCVPLKTSDFYNKFPLNRYLLIIFHIFDFFYFFGSISPCLEPTTWILFYVDVHICVRPYKKVPCCRSQKGRYRPK